MENGFLDKEKDNVAVKACYRDLPYLLDIKVDKHLFRALPTFGILLIVVSLLGEVIWYLQWRNTWPYFVARRF
ncbi:hypothetical protein Gotur_026368 [Gossypium turneri]